MNKIYYSKFNIKAYISSILIIVGFILLYLNLLVPSVIVLVISVLLSDGPSTKDIFIFKDKKFYLLEYKNNMIIRYIFTGLLSLVFTLCLMKKFNISIIIFYILLLSINAYNFLISYANNKIDFNNLLDRELDSYNSYIIKEHSKNNGVIYLTLKNKYKDIISNKQYIINKSFVNSKELNKLLSHE